MISVRRRGFTLIELLVYLALVSTALTVFAGIEINAQRTAVLQRALIDMEMQAKDFLGSMRRDIEGAKKLEVAPKQVLVYRFDGTSVLYEVGARVELDSAGKQKHREAFSLVAGLAVLQEPGSPRLTITCEMADTHGQNTITRTFTRSATPRREVSGD